MKIESTAREWELFARHSLSDSNAALRKGSKFKKAKSWIEGVPSPAMPTKILSNAEIFNGWLNPHNFKLAKTLISQNENLTFRDLVNEMLIHMTTEETTLPYIWWIYISPPKARAIHQDANGVTFVKLNNKWQMALSTQELGALVGAQGGINYEDIPKNAYFVSWENEKIARKYTS